MARFPKRRFSRRGRRPPRLSQAKILPWADAHYKRTGRWPNRASGRVYEHPHETWSAIDAALKIGYRGLPGGSSIGRLLVKRRKVRNRNLLPRLSKKQILSWADAHHRRTGRWPHQKSGPIPGTIGETWTTVADALRMKGRGLRRKCTLTALLREERGVRNQGNLPSLTIAQILARADVHHRRTGQWPRRSSGPSRGTVGETWSSIHAALREGRRGLPGGTTLTELLEKKRGVSVKAPLLKTRLLLQWADAHYRQTGGWPKSNDGVVEQATSENWHNMDRALRLGWRGLPRGTSLAQLLKSKRGVPIGSRAPTLTEKQILSWADAFHKRVSRWPNRSDGIVKEAPSESWFNIDSALRKGLRGLPGGHSLAQFLQKYRGIRNMQNLPRLTLRQILSWADLHHERTGEWPRVRSGAIHGAPGETWKGINVALYQGHRGFAGGVTLARLLEKDRGVKVRLRPWPLTIDEILKWADLHHRRTGRWPQIKDGPVQDASGEVWANVDMALRAGLRGLAGGDSLSRLLRERRPPRGRPRHK